MGEPYRQFLETHVNYLTWSWKWQLIVMQDMDDILTGQIDRAAYAAPPRHGKTKLITEHFPAKYLKIHPYLNCHVSSHTQELVNTFSYNTRDLCREIGILSADSTNIKQWRTYQNGAYRAFGVGGHAHGRGGNLAVIDDPIGSREDAESEKMRQKLKDWYENDVITRMDPGLKAIILIQTRFHEDDLWAFAIGKDPGRWRVRVFPAICDDPENDLLGRQAGEALCPELYSAEELEAIHKEISEYTWLSIYQQRPTAREGLFFKVSQLKIMPGIDRSKVVDLVRYWDLAATDDPANCMTCGVRMGKLEDGTFFVDHVAWCLYTPYERDVFMREIADRDQVFHHEGVRQLEEKQPAAAGVERLLTFAKLMAGLPFGHGTVAGDKITRADPYAGQVGHGNVWLVVGVEMPCTPQGETEWIPKYKEWLRAFPMGARKDPIDASSGAFIELTTHRKEGPSGVKRHRRERRMFG